MDTKNKKLKDKKKNKEYYSKSDGNYFPIDKVLLAHKHVDRIAWARKWIHEFSSRTHLDCGCKDGYLCLVLATEGIECVGVDPSKDAIAEATLRKREFKQRLATEPTFLVGTVEQLPEGIKADTVSCLEVLEHVIDPDIVMKKLCNAGTYVLISTPDIEGMHGKKDAERNFEHLRLYSKKEFEELAGKYGMIVESVVRDGQLCICIKCK